MFLFARCLNLHSSLRRAIDMFSVLLPQQTHWRTKSMTPRSNYPPQSAQILNYWPPWAKNSCESTTSPCGSQILNYLPPRAKNSCESTESVDFTVEWFASTNDAHFESLIASLLSFPTFFWNQKAVVGNLLKILIQLFWSSGSIKAAKHKLISFRSWTWWMITKANIDRANRKHTFLFYGKVNCTSKVKALIWQRAILNCNPDYMSAMWFAHNCRFNYPG